MARFGRPPKAPGQREDARIDFRIRREHKELLQKAAAEAGISLAAWIKERLIVLAKKELRKKK